MNKRMNTYLATAMLCLALIGTLLMASARFFDWPDNHYLGMTTVFSLWSVLILAYEQGKS